MSLESINYNKGYSAKFYITFVNIDTWLDEDRINITGGTITREDSELMQSADVSCISYNETRERLIRIWMDINQNGDTGHIPLFTGWGSVPENQIDGVLMTDVLQCYSILKPAQDILLPPGWYAPVSTDSGELIKELLKPTKAPISFYKKEKPPALKDGLIAEENENNLSMAELIAYTIGWRIQILGDGTIYISPKPKQDSLYDYVAATFDRLKNDILEPSLKISYDWYNCPNVFRAIVEGDYAIARDDDRNSIFSTVSRGREIWAQDSNCDLNENESIAEYAVRRLKELQTVYTAVNYDRRFVPNVVPSDIVRLNYPAQGLVGLFQIVSQSISLGYNARTSEEAIFINE